MTDRTKPLWQPIDEAPLYADVLMAGKPNGHLRWKYGVGSVIDLEGTRIVIDWGWAFPPTLYQEIVEPVTQ